MESKNVMTISKSDPGSAKARQCMSIHDSVFTRCTPSKKKRVSFSRTITVQPIEPFSKQGDKSRLYYNKDEMNTFASAAKFIRILVRSSPSRDGDCMIGLEEAATTSSLRGLELYLFPETRVRNKMVAERLMMSYQQKLNGNKNKSAEEKIMYLAAACSKLSKWSRLVALETARLDSLLAYDGDYMIPVDTNSFDIPPFPDYSVSKRRRVTVYDEQDHSDDSQRSKRRSTRHHE
jgi:hypothetical protein